MSNTTIEKDELTLKWGNLKGWHFRSLGEDGKGNPALNEAIDRYEESQKNAGYGAMQGNYNSEMTEALCDIIEHSNLDSVYLDWDGKDVSKEEAKTYVREYAKSRN